MPTGWTATDSDPATTGLKVSVAQEPANETASDRPLNKNRLESDGTIPFSTPTAHRPAPRLMGDEVRIGLRLGISQFFFTRYSCFKSRQKRNLTKKRDRVSQQLTYNKSCSGPNSNEVAVKCYLNIMKEKFKVLT